MLGRCTGALAAGIGCLLLLLPTAHAQPTTALGKWYCSVLVSDFDPEAAIAAFPLEKLGRAKQSRETDDNTVHVKLVALGDEYEVTYAYSYSVEDVDDRYGFRLSVDEGPDGEFDDTEQMLWLMEFGAPDKNFSGYRVGGGPKLPSGDQRFEFEMWSSGRYNASWFSERDIRHAAAVCAGAKPVPPGTTLANDMSVGPALDKKTDKVSLWFCAALEPGFDQAALFKNFPLETLPAPTETRETDDDAVTVSIASIGDEFSLEYQYSFQTDAFDEPYGFGVFMRPLRGRDSELDDAMAWLRGFGAPTKDVIGLGYQVGAGEPAFGDDPPFKFAVWDTIATRSAQWFFPDDLENAAELCS
jgi:hypothetical protein